MSDPAPRLLSGLLPIAVLAWRSFMIWKVAHEASCRWRLRTAAKWALVLLAVDVVLILIALSVSPSLAGLTRPGTDTTGVGSTAARLAVAGLVSVVVRQAPLKRGGRTPSLQQYIVVQMERVAYDKADDWIYHEVYPVVTGARVKPFLNGIRGYLENQPGAQGSLDASYIGTLIDSHQPLTKEDVRAACHRMLARGGRERLMTLLQEYREAPATTRTERRAGSATM